MADSMRLDGAVFKLVDCSELNVNKAECTGGGRESIVDVNNKHQKCNNINETDELPSTLSSSSSSAYSSAATIPIPTTTATSATTIETVQKGIASLEDPKSASGFVGYLPAGSTANMPLSISSPSSTSLLLSSSSFSLPLPSSSPLSSVAAMPTLVNSTMSMATVLPMASSNISTKDAVHPIPELAKMGPTMIANNAGVGGSNKNSSSSKSTEPNSVQNVGLSTLEAKRILLPPPPPTTMDLQEIEDLRKKRCADRYDSSESSDR